MQYFYSASTIGFYLSEFNSEMPSDAVEITESIWREYLATPPDGQILGADSSGNPAWVDKPPLTEDERKSLAEVKRSNLISVANAYMSDRQWPGKAAIGRLKGDELTQYGLWLDYLDALYAVDTSSPDIEWPSQPA